MPAKHFNSLAEMADTVGQLSTFAALGTWAGQETYEDSLRLCRTGSDALVGAAEKLIERIESEVMPLDRPVWRDAMAGYFANVPAFLAGMPETMRVKRMERDTRAPVRLFCDTGSSGSVKPEHFAQRGTAVLALAMVLSQQRPLELSIVDIGNVLGGASEFIEGDPTANASLVSVRIESAPLELASACYALTSAGLTRNLLYTYAHKQHGFSGRWPWDGLPPNDGSGQAEYVRRVRKALNLAPQDIYLPPPTGGMEKSDMIKNPAAWVNAELDKQSAAEEMGAAQAA